jgi:hypothetical protein
MNDIHCSSMPDSPDVIIPRSGLLIPYGGLSELSSNEIGGWKDIGPWKVISNIVVGSSEGGGGLTGGDHCPEAHAIEPSLQDIGCIVGCKYGNGAEGRGPVCEGEDENEGCEN